MIFQPNLVAEAAFGVDDFVFLSEPEAEGDLCAVEELVGKGAHPVREVGLDKVAAAVASAELDDGFAAICENVADNAVQSEVVDEVLHLEVRVVLWRNAEP